MVRSEQKFIFIDILRGLAVLLVLLVHSGIEFKTTFFSKETLITLFDASYGVQLFFFASSFTIFLSYTNRAKKEQNLNINFFIRRFFRIAPLYYIALIYYIGINGTGPTYWSDSKGITPLCIISNILFVHGFYPTSINSVVPGGWSIAVEMLFYLMVPLLVKYINTINKAIGFFVLTLIIRIISNALVKHFVHIPETWLITDFLYEYLPNQLPVFATGIIFFFIWKNEFNVSGILLIVLAIIVIIHIEFRPLAPHILICVPFIFLAYGLFKINLKGYLVSIMQYIGKISYSIYLVHFAFLDLVKKLPLPLPTTQLNNTLLFCTRYLLLIIISVITATITYNLVELPGQKLGSRLISTSKKTTDLADAGI